MQLINKPKTEKGEKTLNKIIEGAEKVFRDKGYNGSTVKNISKEAGVSVGTFYIYFKDKKSIYDYLLLSYSRYIRRKIAERTANLTSRRQVEREGLLVFLEIVRNKPHIYYIIWESLYIDKQKFFKYYMNFASRYQEGIDQAMESGDMRQDLDSETLSWILMGMSNFLGLRYVMFGQDRSLEEVAELALRVLDKGLFGD